MLRNNDVPVSDFNEESVLHTLQLIRPKLDAFLALSKQVSLRWHLRYDYLAVKSDLFTRDLCDRLL